MTAATARERLLQAVDSHHNVCNMAVVLDVISFLEKHPITKEALEETRLGKLINDIRRTTQNTDLARRAKSLVRSWQKLIQPLDASTRTDHKGAPWSSSEAVTHPNISSSVPSSRKSSCELKARCDLNNNSKTKTISPKTTPDRSHHLKISNTSNGISFKPQMKVDRPLSTSLLLKASVIQQQAATRGQHRKKKSKRTPPHKEDINSESSILGNGPQTFNSVKVKCSNEAKSENDGLVSVSNNQLVPGSLHLTDWKELSKCESIKTYLSHQSSVLSAMFQESKCSGLEGRSEVRSGLTWPTESPQRWDAPAICRAVTPEDVERLHTRRWAGVNGCFDGRGNWSDWTQSMSVEAHEDGSRLQVLPYVCLD